jgi:molybdate transport system ATP-binding protein
MDVLTRPRSVFAARLAGLNLMTGTAVPNGLKVADGTELTGASEAIDGQPAVAVFSPGAVTVHVDPPTGSARNVIRDRVTALEPQGALIRVRGAGGVAADLTPASAVELGLNTGTGVWFVVKAAELAVHPTHGARPLAQGDSAEIKGAAAAGSSGQADH